MDNQLSGSGYGKRPLWQSVLIYVIAGGLLYGAVYYFVLRKNVIIPYIAPAQNQQQQPLEMSQNQTISPSTQVPSPVHRTRTTNPPAPVTPSTPVAKSFTVHANDSTADITIVKVNKGALVQITFSVDSEGTYHGGLDFRSSVVSTGAISPGSSKTISFTANNSFSFVPYWPSTNIQKPYLISVVVQ